MISGLFIAIGISSFARESELSVAKTKEGAASRGKPQSYDLLLSAGDYARLKLDPRGQQLTLKTYDPSGHEMRGARLGPAEDRFDFIADRSGKYRLEIAASENLVDATYAITLEKIVSLPARLAPLRPLYASPRINALKAAVAAGKFRSVHAFWQQIAREGAPLVEPLPGDEKNMLITFLWKSRPDTRNVFVAWLPYAGAVPDDYFMERIADTDVWYKTLAADRRTRFEYSLAPNVPRIRPVSQGIDNDAIAMIAAAARTDPLNPKRWRVNPQNIDAIREERSMVEMPDAPPQPFIVQKVGTPAGQIEKRRFKSTLLNNEREVAAYLPPGYSHDAKPFALLIIFDEINYLGDPNQIVLIPTPTILDNLIAAKRIPSVVALFIGNVPDGRDRELGCNPLFADFLSSELLPWARSLYNITVDPRLTVITGSSLGGVAAACAALRHSENFGNVLSQSGAFHWPAPPGDPTPNSGMAPEPNWIARQFIASPKLPLRFYLDAGSEEFDANGDGSSILMTNRNLRDVLLAKGYEVHFQEFAGGHDYLSWRGTLADGLMALMGIP
jgi:enterochelin esterase family protein